jgi:hypothetical protein
LSNLRLEFELRLKLPNERLSTRSENRKKPGTWQYSILVRLPLSKTGGASEPDNPRNPPRRT